MALLAHLGIDNVNVFGYSVGAGVAMQVAIDRPDVVGRLVLSTASYSVDGMHPA